MILKPSQNRRALSRRALLLAILPTTAAVGIVAALRPAAVAGTALFQHTFSNGAVLERVADSGAGKIATPLVLTLHYALSHQPQSVWIATPIFNDEYFSQGNGVYLNRPVLWTWGANGSIQTKNQPMTVTTASQAVARYQFTVKPSTTVSPLFVGVAAGPWTLSVDGPKKDGKVYLSQPSGQMIWTLVRHKHQEGALLMVSDHFHTPSPLTSQNDTQTAMHDIENYQRLVYAVDSAGRILAELPGSLLTTPDADEPGNIGRKYQTFKFMQTIHVSSALLRRTAKFRLVARPYEWTKLTVGSPKATH